MELRPYQQEARAAVEQDWSDGFHKTLLVLPTGCGKTIVFCKIVEDMVRQGGRCLILAHRGELLEQAADKLLTATGLRCAVEKAEESCLDSWYRVTVGSVQTLMREKRLQQFPTDFFNAIVVDEAHHVLADSYQRVLEHFPAAKVLGVTATPDRGDMRNLGQYFEHLAYEYSLPRAIKEGYLSPIKAVTIPLKLDLTGVGIQAGDFKNSDLDTALDPYLHQIAREMRTYCAQRKTVVFLPLVRTSQKFRDILEQEGFRAAEVNGSSEDRAEVLRDFNDGKYNVLCNSMLLTEGWDCPSVDCVVVLRPTKIRSLYCQMVGRGTRTAPGKDHLLLLDFLWHTERHELCHPASLICESPEVAQRMTEALEDPLQFEMSIQAEDLAGYVPSFGWEMSPPSDKQVQSLEKWGIRPDEIECAGKASLLLDRLAKRRSEGLTTPKQIRFLEGKGFQHVGQWQFEEARNMIDRIASQGWKIPAGVTPSAYVPVSMGG